MDDKPSKLGVAWTAGRPAGRRLLGRAVGARDLELGEALTGQLDQMKGLAMKVGQIVSYLDVPLPEAVQDQLARLQTGQRGMAQARTRQVIETALGQSVEALFEVFDWQPVAAASIGQVHRAQLDALPVAVKVQYPDVAHSFTDDLRAVGRISSLASLASAVDGKAIVTELGRRLVEECDYAREARAQRAFAAAFASDAEVRVPAVVSARSADTVLTTAWIDGDSFETLRHSADPARIDAVASTLVRFTYRCLLQLGAIQADPHPGNFLFPGQGGVAFLDFGCVRVLDIAMVQALRALAEAVRDHDRRRFREATLALGVVGRPEKFDHEHFFAVMEHLFRPLIAPRFEFGPDYVRRAYALNGPTSPNARTLSIPPGYVWVMRLQWGLWSILARLGASGSFNGVLEDILAAPIEPLDVDSPAAAAPSDFRTEVRP